MLGCVCVAGFYGQQLHAWSATADFTLRAREKMGSQEGCASNLGMRMRHKEPIIMPITCAASRFPCISAWEERCSRIGERARLQWAASLVCEHATRRIRGYSGHWLLRCRRRLISPLLSPRFGVSPDPQIGPATLASLRSVTVRTSPDVAFCSTPEHVPAH